MNPNPNRSLATATYDGWRIPNRIDPDPTPSFIAFCLKGLQLTVAAAHQNLGPPSGRYNCHGLVFASRRTNIDSAQLPVDIDDVLRRDRYVKVAEAQVGDVITYRLQGNIEHSGHVCRIDEGLGAARIVFVWSKWGALGEYEHRENVYMFANDATIEYWRLRR